MSIIIEFWLTVVCLLGEKVELLISNKGIQKVNYELIKTASQFERVITLLNESRAIGIDSETTGLDPFTSRLHLLQIAIPERVYIIDLFRTPDLIKTLFRLFQTERPTKIFHNAKFDLKMLSHHYGIKVNGIFDTMLASQLIACGSVGERHSLNDVLQSFLGVGIEKGEQGSDWSTENLTQDQLEYAALFCIMQQEE